MTQQQFQPQTQGIGQQSQQPLQSGGQQFQPQATTQQSQGMTGTGAQQGTGQRGSKTMSNTLPDAQWTGLTSVAQAIAICEFCADQCIQEASPHMIECIRLCEDVADLGKAVLSLVPHQSRNAQPVVSAFEQAVQACAQECGQHQHAHCQECAQVLDGTLDATYQLTQAGGMQSGIQSSPSGGMGPSQF